MRSNSLLFGLLEVKWTYFCIIIINCPLKIKIFKIQILSLQTQISFKLIENPRIVGYNHLLIVELFHLLRYINKFKHWNIFYRFCIKKVRSCPQMTFVQVSWGLIHFTLLIRYVIYTSWCTNNCCANVKYDQILHTVAPCG